MEMRVVTHYGKQLYIDKSITCNVMLANIA